MTTVPVTENIAVGLSELDGEHSVQMGLLAALRQSVNAHQDAASTNTILEQLNAYTNAHFMAEQLLMRLHAYPHYEEHLAEHDRLVEKMQALQQAQAAGHMDLTLDAADALAEWLLRHTQGSDRKLGSFLLEQG
jgi:hemerythrin-like metal-binding protein